MIIRDIERRTDKFCYELSNKIDENPQLLFHTFGLGHVFGGLLQPNSLSHEELANLRMKKQKELESKTKVTNIGTIVS